MKIYVKASVSDNYLTLDMFDVDEYDYKTPYAEMHCVEYLLNIDGYKIKLYMGFGRLPYSISFTYPSGYKGEVSGFKTAQEAVDYLNDKKWWTWKEPTQDDIDRARKYDEEMHRLNEEALRTENHL